MDTARRQAIEASLGLAVVMSLAAAVLAVVFDAVGYGSRAVLVGIVVGVGFTMSWVLTGRVVRRADAVPAHRVAVVAARHRVG